LRWRSVELRDQPRHRSRTRRRGRATTRDRRSMNLHRTARTRRLRSNGRMRATVARIPMAFPATRRVPRGCAGRREAEGDKTSAALGVHARSADSERVEGRTDRPSFTTTVSVSWRSNWESTSGQISSGLGCPGNPSQKRAGTFPAYKAPERKFRGPRRVHPRGRVCWR
jgi:hypothetical protein